MPKFLVETISVHRIRYCIECDSCDDAKDTVVMEECEEFGQKHIGENIVSCREVSDDEIPPLFFEDSPYLEQWGPSKAFEYCHKVNY